MRLTSEAAPPSAPAPSASSTGLTTVSEAAEEVPKYGVEGTEHELLERVREKKRSNCGRTDKHINFPHPARVHARRLELRLTDMTSCLTHFLRNYDDASLKEKE